ncbi:YceD family protein [Brevundimonas sp. R86498]|uniref:YceD family protein n=1 Tax=Brevundimonas sp. R86498 TaxID=3093845 RepID=UPI0037C81B40
MNPDHRLPFSDVVRINEIGAGLTRTLVPDDAARALIVKALDLGSLERFEAELALVPGRAGWTLNGRVIARLEQICGITLEPLPVAIDERFSVELVEPTEREPDEVEVEITLDDDAPDVIEDGRIDLGQYAVEQLALTLDPFPRKPGAEFVQPEEPAEISPFAVLKALRTKDGDEKS